MQRRDLVTIWAKGSHTIIKLSDACMKVTAVRCELEHLVMLEWTILLHTT